MSSVLNVSNASGKSEEYSIKDIEMLVDSKEQNWFKWAQVGKFLGLKHIDTSVEGLDKYEMLAKNDKKATPDGTEGWPGPKYYQNKTEKFLSAFGAMCVIIKSQKDKGKALKKHILKDILPRGFDAKIKEFQGKHQQAIEEKDATLAFLNENLKIREYENVGLKGEIRAKDQPIAVLQKCYVGYLSDEDKKNEISIIVKNNNYAEYPYISICRQHGYRRHKVSVLLTRNKGSTLFSDGDTPNATVTYNFLQEHRLFVVNPNRPRHFRLDTISQE